MNQETYDYVTEHYVRPSSTFFQGLEQFAKENEVPIMDPYGMSVLLQWLRIQQPKRILEIGSAIGYSALRMHEILPEATIVTIERDETRYAQACENVKNYGADSHITLIYGDALEVAEEALKRGPYDAIFIDAAKGQYERFVSLYEPSLADSGVIYSDNILFRGFVAEGEAEVKSRRRRALIRKIRRYNDWLMKHPEYDTIILPVGDGIAVSKKKR